MHEMTKLKKKIQNMIDSKSEWKWINKVEDTCNHTKPSSLQSTIIRNNARLAWYVNVRLALNHRRLKYCI